MNIFATTHKGLIRKQNQDCYVFRILSQSLSFAILCDGMGGEKAGDVASRTACEVITNRLMASLSENTKPLAIKNILDSVISVANTKVYEMSQSESKYSGMGTTVIVAVAMDDIVYICSAGDSRVYSVNKENCTQLTVDHTVAQSLLEAGEITEEEAKKHPKKHYITRALGVEKSLNTDYFEYNYANSAILFCTDGFSNYADEATIKNLVQDAVKETSAENLITFALEQGGSDNVTAIVLVGGSYNG